MGLIWQTAHDYNRVSSTLGVPQNNSGQIHEKDLGFRKPLKLTVEVCCFKRCRLKCMKDEAGSWNYLKFFLSEEEQAQRLTLLTLRWKLWRGNSYIVSLWTPEFRMMLLSPEAWDTIIFLWAGISQESKADSPKGQSFLGMVRFWANQAFWINPLVYRRKADTRPGASLWIVAKDVGGSCL